VLYGLIEAEDLGINSRTSTLCEEPRPVVKRLLGQKETLVGLGLPNDFVARAVRKVGNYGEIYNRNGPSTPFKLERSVKTPSQNGGLHYAPRSGKVNR